MPVYVGVEAVFVANGGNILVTNSGSVTTPAPLVAVRPALWLGFRIAPRWGLETGAQFVPMTSAYEYHEGGINFSDRYRIDYLYVPARGLWQVTAPGRRLQLEVLAAAGPVLTNTVASDGSYSSSLGGYMSASVLSATGSPERVSTQFQGASEKVVFALFEVGGRGSWRVLPQLSLDFTLRQLWGKGGGLNSTLRVYSDAQPFRSVTAALTAPFGGLCTGVGVRYLF